MKGVTSVLALLVCGVVYGQESTVKVLAVQLPPGAYTTEITQQMADLASHWPNPNGVTVTLINGGIPVYLNAGIGSDPAGTQLQAAKAALVAADTRGVADVVIFFSPYVTGVCGTAPMTNWNTDGRHAFIANASGLDLDGADLFYAALVKIGSCPPETAIHEFGHLFSAGHSPSGPNAATAGSYLLPKNHAYWFSTYAYPTGTISQKTIMAQGGIGGNQLWVFSAFPSVNTDNLSGLAYTARSVANYRTGVDDSPSGPTQCSDGTDNDGDGQSDFPSDAGCSSPSDLQEYGVPEVPGCGLTPPIIVSGAMTGVCVPSVPYTSHLLTWIDACPSAATHYQVWYNQYGGYVFGWSSLVPINNMLVWGANAEIKVKSCYGLTCTSMSSDSYVAASGC